MILEYRQCSRCVLDTTAKDITFDARGLCNYCKKFDSTVRDWIFMDENKKKEQLNYIVEKIKRLGQNKPYDCILGLSGGVDSTYLAYFAKKKLGLRPLAVHFDNGWDSEVAVRNIKQIVSTLDFDLYTHVIHWDEFKDLQLAYLRASVIDIEVPTDQLIFASLYKIAYQKKIKTILSGNNNATEFTMPRGWNYEAKMDFVNLSNIHRQYGSLKLRDFPRLGYYHRYFYDKIARIRQVFPLEYVSYIKKDVKEIIKNELGWKDYGTKHYESIFTRFYQGYILPKKFHIDKRKAHLSNLICSGQMTREEALEELKEEPYPVEQQSADREYVIKKFGLTEAEFENIMRLPIRNHAEFGYEKDDLKLLRILVQKLKRFFVKNRG